MPVASIFTKSNITNFLVKGAGVAAMGMVAYDAHKAGQYESSAHQQEVKARSMMESYTNSMRLESPSTITSSAKRAAFNLNADDNLSPAFTSFAGYLKGFGNMLVNSIVPLGLSVGTVATKGWVSKGFGAGLLLYGAITLGHDVFGIGKRNQLNKEMY